MQRDSTMQLDAYACGINSTEGSSFESGPAPNPEPRTELQAPTSSLGQVTKFRTGPVNSSLSQ